MDLYQLRYFLEVARRLSFTRAAESLYVSPAATSRSVALLERSIGKRLLHRTRRRVWLTAEGALVKDRLEQVFDKIGTLELELGGQVLPAGLLRIGSREMITHYLLPGAFLGLVTKYPQARFGLYELGARELAQALKQDRLEVGFFYSDLSDPALDSTHLGALRSHIYASKQLLARTETRPDFRSVLRLPFVVPRYFEVDPSLPSVDGFPDDRFPRKVRFEAEFLETHRRYVLDGLAVGVLPDLTMTRERRDGRVIAVKGPPISRHIYAFRRKGRPLPALVDALLAALRTQLRAAAARHAIRPLRVL